MDNPFIGLDAVTRTLLLDLLEHLSRKHALQLVLVLSMLDDIPSFVTHVVPVEGKMIADKMTRETYQNEFHFNENQADTELLYERILDLPYSDSNYTSEEVVKLNKVSIRYGERTIFRFVHYLDLGLMQVS